LELFTICPPHVDVFGGGSATGGDRYAQVLDDHCAWADKLGASAMLIYEFWPALDPWVAAQAILARGAAVEPIVAVTPGLSHPAMVARRIAGLHYLYQRRINLNVVTGAKATDIAALGGPGLLTQKYPRLLEFIDSVHAVLRGEPFRGAFYQSDVPAPGAAPQPRVLVPASTSEGFAAALPRLDRCLVMAKPLAECAAELDRLTAHGLRTGVAMIVGIVARATDAEATRLAQERHGGSRRDALVQRAFRGAITSSQHRAVLALADERVDYDECLWYGAGRIGIDCPKLVGSYQAVARSIHAYRALGVRTLVLDLPAEAGEYEHVSRVLQLCGRP
jgi:alkanesulfonate monooxygenase